MKQARELAEKQWKSYPNPPLRWYERMSLIMPLMEAGDTARRCGFCPRRPTMTSGT
ncbi:MAG: hypothetical protein U0903_10110 [Planctomycetales bacterium]